MKITKRFRQILRLQSASFTVLFLAVLALLAWAGTRYTAQADWTYGNRNTLSQPSRELLRQLDGEVTLKAVVADNKRMRRRIRDVASRYTRASDKVSLRFINPRTHPQTVRELGVRRQGTIVVAHAGRTAKVRQPKEVKISNAIKRLSDSSQTTLGFLTGHGERDLTGRGRLALSVFKRGLENQGYSTRTVNLARKPVPEAVNVLVVADPRDKLLPAERERIRTFVEGGGNLLWLADTGARTPPRLGEKRVVDFGSGTVASPVRVFGADRVAFGVVTDYTGTGLTRELSKTTVFPKARPVRPATPGDWSATRILKTSAKSWADAKPFDAQFDKAEDRKGPLSLGVALTRPMPEKGKPGDETAKKTDTGNTKDGKTASAASGTSGGGKSGGGREQRVVVLGDADFMANGFIGFAGNRELAMRTVKWLSGDSARIDIATPQPPGRSLSLSATAMNGMRVLFMGALPAAFLAVGVGTWLRQRRR